MPSGLIRYVMSNASPLAGTGFGAGRSTPVRQAVAGALLCAFGIASAGTVAAISGLLRLPPAPAAIMAALLFAAMVALLVVRLRRGFPLAEFGACNQVTLLRLALTCLLAGTVMGPGVLAAPISAWAALAVAGTALALDGIDGWLARRAGTETAFGARFDMEVDAGLVLVLSMLALLGGKAGAWVLALGAMRYAFLGAGALFPWMRAPLPPSLRRKAICVVQVGVLTVLLAPVVTPPLSHWLALGALAALGWSFAVDVLWLWRRRSGAAAGARA